MRTALALAAAATLAGTGLVAAPASARTFVSVGIGVPIYRPYPVYGGGFFRHILRRSTPPADLPRLLGSPRYWDRGPYGRPHYWRDGRGWRGGRRW